MAGFGTAIRSYFHPRVITMAVLGIPYGMIFWLAVQTLQAWLTEDGIDVKQVGFFAFATLPNVFKFLWAPFINFISIPFLHRLGSRRSWLIFSHICLILLLNLLAVSDPVHNLIYAGILSFLLLVFAGIQDIVVDAYRIEILKKDQAGPGIGMLSVGYRVGAFFATFGCLSLAELYSWERAYQIMSALVSFGVIAALLNPEPKGIPDLKKGHALDEDDQKSLPALFRVFLFKHLIPPLTEFFSRKGCWYVILFIILYRIGDAFIHNMHYSFFISADGIGFSKKEIADIVKLFGMFPTLVGGLIGGIFSARFKIHTSLFVAGAIHALTHVMYVLQAVVGYDPTFLYAVIFLEHITGGITTAVFLLYLSCEAHPRYIPTQFALFTSMWTFPTFIAGWSGVVVHAMEYNWQFYFSFCMLISLPSLALTFKLRQFPVANPGGLAKS